MRIVRLEAFPQASLDHQPLENRLDVVHAAEDALEPRPAPAAEKHGKIAGIRIAEPLPVDEQRHAGCEDRLPDDVLAPPGELDDDAVGQVRP